MTLYPHSILFLSNIVINLVYLHVTMRKVKGSLTSHGQILANENKFSFCAPRPGFLLLVIGRAENDSAFQSPPNFGDFPAPPPFFPFFFQ